MVSNARRLQSLFSQMLAAGGRHSFSMTHGLSELTASTVQARLTPLTGFEIQKKKSCTNVQADSVWRAFLHRGEGMPAHRCTHICTAILKGV